MLKKEDIPKRIGKGEGGNLLPNLGSLLNAIAEGTVVGEIALNGETYTPVRFGEDEPAILLSDEQGEGGFDVSTDNSVKFTVDGSAMTEITFAENDIIADNEAATAEEIAEFINDAAETASEDNSYAAIVKGQGAEAQVGVYSKNDNIPNNKVEIAAAADENTALGFDENDVDYGKQGLGVKDRANTEYNVQLTITGETSADDQVMTDNLAEDGFRVYCETAASTYDVHVLINGEAQ